jgi:hypothetical protein
MGRDGRRARLVGRPRRGEPGAGRGVLRRGDQGRLRLRPRSPACWPATSTSRPCARASSTGSTCAPRARSLTERYGEAAIVERCGKALSTQAIGPKLLWLRNHEPAVWERTRRWYSAHSYTVARLTGEYVLDHHTASQCDPLYDLAAGDWHRPWAEDIAPGLELPRLAWSGEVVGTVHAEPPRSRACRSAPPLRPGRWTPGRRASAPGSGRSAT